jgi:radical SAM superfamily enzyme YgiQ (UPF0313 family)
MSVFKKAVAIASGQIEKNRPPPGLGFLAGVCEHNQVDYDVYDLNVYILDMVGEKDWLELYDYTSVYSDENFNPVLDEKINTVLESFVDLVIESSPDIILITTLTYWENYWCQRLLEKIKQKNIQAVTMVGGPGVSAQDHNQNSFGKQMCNKGILDYYVLGEGDIVLDQFFKGHKELGVNSSKDLVETWAIQIDDLDSIPVSSYKKIDINRYQTYQGSGEISVTTSRGCVRRCTFCDVGNTWKKFKFRSATNVAEEIRQHYLATGCTKFFFTDSLINGPLKNFINLMEELVKLQEVYPDLKQMSFSAQFIIRPKSHHTEYMYQLMQKVNFQNIQVGVETGSDRVRHHMKKGFTNEDLDYHMEMCNKYKLGNTLLFLVGYPTETLEDFEDTLNMLKRYQKYLMNGVLIDANESIPLILLKDTPLHEMAPDLGIELDNKYANIRWISKKNPELTIKERFRRYIMMQRLMINLGYPRPATTAVQLSQYIEKIKSLGSNTHVD